jgi:hypothetical protein
VAHSRGGAVVAALAEAFVDDFRRSVFFVAFTSSTDTVMKDESASAILLRRIAVNYETSHQTLGTPLPEDGKAIRKVIKKDTKTDRQMDGQIDRPELI